MVQLAGGWSCVDAKKQQLLLLYLGGFHSLLKASIRMLSVIFTFWHWSCYVSPLFGQIACQQLKQITVKVAKHFTIFNHPILKLTTLNVWMKTLHANTKLQQKHRKTNLQKGFGRVSLGELKLNRSWCLTYIRMLWNSLRHFYKCQRLNREDIAAVTLLANLNGERQDNEHDGHCC